MDIMTQHFPFFSFSRWLLLSSFASTAIVLYYLYTDQQSFLVDEIRSTLNRVNALVSLVGDLWLSSLVWRGFDRNEMKQSPALLHIIYQNIDYTIYV
jgi:hypothetical protein